jgi:hypothetical protein
VFGVVIRSQARQCWVHRISLSVAGLTALTDETPKINPEQSTIAASSDARPGENGRLLTVVTVFPTFSVHGDGQGSEFP